MAWNLTDDVETFLTAAGDFLRSRPAEHTVLLTVTETMRVGARTAYGDEPPLFGWWTGPGGAPEGAFVRTPPRPALLTPLPGDAAASLAGLWDLDRPLPGVTAEQRTAEAFAEAWRARTGAVISVNRRSRLYRLAGLLPPDPMPPGRARVATVADRELLLKWFEAFSLDLGAPDTAGERHVDDRLRYGGLTLWEIDGTPVSLAGVSRTVAGAARVSPVYTPSDLRGRGYAGAATAAVSGAALDAGAGEVLLFTDLANPTSNALYQRIGYVPVSDRVSLDFGK
ncbi:GNAT family N-acetyltransferase [Streptomyces sp. NPDC059373]